MSKPLLLRASKKKEPELRDKPFRSGLEEKIAQQLDDAKIKYVFEGEKLPYVVPSRNAKYLPDFRIGNVIIEGKGRFTSHMTRCPRCTHTFPVGSTAEARQKMVLVKEHHPDLDIRFVFNRANSPIYPKSETTYADWCDSHGFKWANGGKVPADWIKELKG